MQWRISEVQKGLVRHMRNLTLRFEQLIRAAACAAVVLYANTAGRVERLSTKNTNFRAAVAASGLTCIAIEAWLAAVHPDDRERVQRVTKMQRSGKYNEEFRVVRPDQSVRWVHERALKRREPTLNEQTILS